MEKVEPCPHSDDGWCLTCVAELVRERLELQTVVGNFKHVFRLQRERDAKREPVGEAA